MKKILLIISIVFLLILGSIGYSKYSNNKVISTQNLSPTPLTEIQKESSLSLDFGDGNNLTYNETPTSETTAFSLLKDAADRNNLTLVTKQYSFGIFIESINGKVSSQEKAWIYFVNGEGGNIAADKYIVKPEDKIEWKYITPSGN